MLETWHLHLTRPCCVALSRVLIWVMSLDWLRSWDRIYIQHCIPCVLFVHYKTWTWTKLHYNLDHHQPGARHRRSQTTEEALPKAHWITSQTNIIPRSILTKVLILLLIWSLQCQQTKILYEIQQDWFRPVSRLCFVVIVLPLSTQVSLKAWLFDSYSLSIRSECYLYSYHSAVVINQDVARKAST